MARLVKVGAALSPIMPSLPLLQAVSEGPPGSQRNNKSVAIQQIVDGSQNEGIDILDTGFDVSPSFPNDLADVLRVRPGP